MKAKMRLIIEVDYKLNGVPEQELVSKLKYLAVNAVGNGELTGYTEAEVNEWSSKVEIIEDLGV